MPTVVYPALAEAAGVEGYQARFPDFPACDAVGPTLTELLTNAREALRATLLALNERDEEWPKPTPMEDLAARQTTKTAGLLLVDVEVEDAPVRVNISIGEQLLKRIDQAAEARGMTRSGFIAHAARAQLGAGWAGFRVDDRQWDTADLQRQMSEMGKRMSDAFGPGSAFQAQMKDLEKRIREEARQAGETLQAAFRAGKPADPPPSSDEAKPS